MGRNLRYAPPGVPRAGELTRVFATTHTGDTGSWSYPEYEEIAKVAAFSGVAAATKISSAIALRIE